MDPITALMVGGGFLANLYANQQAAKAARKERNLVNSQIADLTAWKNIETKRPYTDSAAGRNILTKAFNKYRDSAMQAKSTAAITGASDEAVLAQQAGSEEALGNVMSDVAAQGTAREDNINNQYRAQLSNLMAQKLGLTAQKAAGAGNLASSAGSFLTSIAPGMASATGKTAKPVDQVWDSVLGTTGD